MKKNWLVLALALIMVFTLFAGCTTKPAEESKDPDVSTQPSDTPEAKGSVYYLNFKPEQDEDWQALAAAYEAETGVPTKVVTAASGQYETTLMSEMGKSAAPTLFQVNGPVGLANWKDYCYDLSGSAVYGELTSDDFALIEDGTVYGIAYVYEGFGIIVNTALLAEAGYAMSDITNFETLKAAAEDITERSAELGFSAFSSAGMDGSSDWRFKSHLANMPLFYEFRDNGIDSTPATIEGTYLDNYKNIWDLYISNSTADPKQLSAKTGDDSRADFVNGQAVFYQNGTWEYDNIASVGDENIGFLPIYTGVDGEENQSVCTGTENYWVVNSKASEDDIQATLDFLYWVVTSEAGTTALAEDMGFVCPFEAAKPTANILCNIMNDYVAGGKYAVTWAFNYMPSEEYKNGVGSALTGYAAGTGSWDDVVTAFVDGWATEYTLVNG